MIMIKILLAAFAILTGFSGALASDFDPAVAFGARESVEHLSLSPDGKSIAFVTPGVGQASTLFIAVIGGGEPIPALKVSGNPDRLGRCDWVATARLVCIVYGVVVSGYRKGAYYRYYAVDADGSNQKLLSEERWLWGGEIIDWLPEENGIILMRRANDVNRVDTRTLKTTLVERGRGACTYISDGHGQVRIMGMCRMFADTGIQLSVVGYFYRPKSDKRWMKLSDYDFVTHAGFEPAAIDAARDTVLGLQRKDGRLAAYELTLDGRYAPKLLYARPDVDISGFVYFGRSKRPVGVTYTTDVPQIHYFDPVLEKLQASMSRSLPGNPTIRIIDASLDESKLLIFAGSDRDPGIYYLLDRSTRQMTRLMAARPGLADRTLAVMKPISYPASDGMMIPAYLTLPVGGARSLPAIVLPHGGPAARDEWGFDWLPQYFAARGYAVLQPQFRGSTGYGEEWFQKNGFQSWRLAIGDVLDAGRWLISQGIADPRKLAVVGWSYGGYAALQSVVVDPQLFKAAVAVAPVTDLPKLKLDSQGWSNSRLVKDLVGSGPHVQEGSPAQNAHRIKVPILLFHGKNDVNVSIEQTELMDEKLRDAGTPHELVIFDGLDHQLKDSQARADLLRKSDAFLRKSMGIPAN